VSISVIEHNEELARANKEMQARIINLEAKMEVMAEENQLLKDFTYNVNPDAKEQHANKYL
jgi:hypothetical protein